VHPEREIEELASRRYEFFMQEEPELPPLQPDPNAPRSWPWPLSRQPLTPFSFDEEGLSVQVDQHPPQSCIELKA